MTPTAKILKSGAGQTVRLPREFRFDADEVGIRRIGSAVVLFPKDAAWDIMAQTLGQADEDFLNPRHQPRSAERRKSLRHGQEG